MASSTNEMREVPAITPSSTINVTKETLAMIPTSLTVETQTTSVMIPSSPTSEIQEMSAISPSSPTNDVRDTSDIMPRQMMRDHDEWVRGVVHLPGGQRVVTCSNDGSLRQWDLESGIQIGDDWRDQDDGVGVITISLSPNSKTIASGSGDGTVKLWDVETGKVTARWTGHTRSVWSVCWSPDGERVLSGSHDGTARVWEVESGETDTTKIGTGGYRGNAAQIWDAKTGSLLSTIEHERPVYSLNWTSDGKKLISGSDVGTIRIFDTATLSQIAILERHHKAVLAISLSRSNRLLASASQDRTVRLWNLDTNLPIGPPLRHEASVFCAAISVDGKLLVTGCNDYNAYVWDIGAILREVGLEDILSIPDPSNDEIDAVDKSFLEAEATGDPDQVEDTHKLPREFFDDIHDGAYSSTVHHPHPHPSRRQRSSTITSLGSRPRAALTSLSSLFRNSHQNAQNATHLQEHPRQGFLPRLPPRDYRPPIVEIACAQDRQSLYVSPQSKKKAKIQLAQSPSLPQATTSAATPVTSTAAIAATPSNPAVAVDYPRWLISITSFVCCVRKPH